MQFIFATISEKHGRATNQDFLGYRLVEGVGCWVLADGLGGHRGGEVAARIAVEAVITSFIANPEVSATALKQHIAAAQAALLSRQQAEPALAAMRTTLVVLLATPQAAGWAHVGDSRLYYFRNGRLNFQTRDHSVPQSLANAGEIDPEEIRFHEDRNRLLRAVGEEGQANPTVEIGKWGIQSGDAFLLCTDGFWEQVTETAMEVDLGKVTSPENWLKMMQSRLMRQILDQASPSRDNYSAIALFIEN